VEFDEVTVRQPVFATNHLSGAGASVWDASLVEYFRAIPMHTPCRIPAVPSTESVYESRSSAGLPDFPVHARISTGVWADGPA